MKLHLGCGDLCRGHIKDRNDATHPDHCADYVEYVQTVPETSVDEILLVHSLSYLSLAQARDFFSQVCTKVLRVSGLLIIETPELSHA